jgi:hypothetical protein
MRRTYISPEFEYTKVFGTFNMKEESSFFGSKMLEIEDMIEVHNLGIIYYQTANKEQLDFEIESSLTPVVYSSADDKKANHTLVIDETQTSFQRDTKTRYILTIDLKTILTNYLFATLKQARTFEGVRNIMVSNGDIDFAIKEYIIKNVYDRYIFDKIELYVRYQDLRSQNIRRFVNTWNPNEVIISEGSILRDIQTQVEFDYSKLVGTFNQEQNSQQYSFEYYFKLFWTKL